MKAYKVEVLVLDFENYGEEQIDLMLSNVRGLMCSVQKIQYADIGEWSDDNPLNHRTTAAAEYNRLFPTPTAAVSAAPSGEVERWINVEDQLPSVSGMVLTCGPTFNEAGNPSWIESANYDAASRFFAYNDKDDEEHYQPAYWMPMIATPTVAITATKE